MSVKNIYFPVVALLLVFLIISNSLLFSINNNKVKEKKKKSNEVKIFLKEQKHFWTYPFKLNKKNLLFTGGMILTTMFLINNDEGMYKAIKKYQSEHKWISDLSPQITKMGDGIFSIGVISGFYLTGLIFKDKKAKKTADYALVSLLHSAVIVQVLKHISGRQRPEIDGNDKWNWFSSIFKRYDEGFAYYDSFPSGHTITAWSLFTVIAKMYGNNPVVPIVCYSLATLAGLSRITEDAHWFSDVFVGAVLGYSIANYVVKKRNKNLMILPYVSNDRVGFGISYVF